jgi:hypothetical protein
MNKLVLSLVVLSLLSSCGKNNKTGSNAAPPAPAPVAVVPVVTNAITSAVSGGVELGAKIDDYTNQFGVGQIYYYGQPQTWGTLANTGLELSYRYTKSATPTGTSTDPNCVKKWLIFTVCSYSSMSSSSISDASVSRYLVNSSVNIEEKKNELKAYINNANPLIPISVIGTSHMFKTRDGKSYIIDTRYPIQANPIGVVDTAGVNEYMFDIRAI